MGKSTIYTISMAIFNSRLYVYQRLSPECLSIPIFQVVATPRQIQELLDTPLPGYPG
jgi:hypothetical protein